MRDLPVPPSTDDAGHPDPRVVAALTAYAADPRRRPEAVAAVQASRLLVPVLPVPATPGAGSDGVEMATALLTGADGRLALLTFTGLPALRAWDHQARPVPVPARLAARSALQDGASAMLVDVAGPVRLVVTGEDLQGLAHGWSLARVGGALGWVRTTPIDSAGETSIG